MIICKNLDISLFLKYLSLLLFKMIQRNGKNHFIVLIEQRKFHFSMAHWINPAIFPPFSAHKDDGEDISKVS